MSVVDAGTRLAIAHALSDPRRQTFTRTEVSVALAMAYESGQMTGPTDEQMAEMVASWALRPWPTSEDARSRYEERVAERRESLRASVPLPRTCARPRKR